MTALIPPRRLLNGDVLCRIGEKYADRYFSDPTPRQKETFLGILVPSWRLSVGDSGRVQGIGESCDPRGEVQDWVDRHVLFSAPHLDANRYIRTAIQAWAAVVTQATADLVDAKSWDWFNEQLCVSEISILTPRGGRRRLVIELLLTTRVRGPEAMEAALRDFGRLLPLTSASLFETACTSAVSLQSAWEVLERGQSDPSGSMHVPEDLASLRARVSESVSRVREAVALFQTYRDAYGSLQEGAATRDVRALSSAFARLEAADAGVKRIGAQTWRDEALADLPPFEVTAKLHADTRAHVIMSEVQTNLDRWESDIGFGRRAPELETLAIIVDQAREDLSWVDAPTRERLGRIGYLVLDDGLAADAPPPSLAWLRSAAELLEAFVKLGLEPEESMLWLRIMVCHIAARPDLLIPDDGADADRVPVELVTLVEVILRLVLASPRERDLVAACAELQGWMLAEARPWLLADSELGGQRYHRWLAVLEELTGLSWIGAAHG